MASRAPTPPVKDIVISTSDPELVEILKEIKQILDIREGRLGSDIYRFIDYDELLRILTGDETIVVTVLPQAHTHAHNNLTGLQGLGPQYNHLTDAEYAALGTHPDHNDLNGIQGSGPDYYHLTSAEYGNLHPPDIIEEGNSYVEVIDTGTGEIVGNVDGLQVFRAWNDAGFGRVYSQTSFIAGTQNVQAGFLYLQGDNSPTGAGGQIALFCDEDNYPSPGAYVFQPVDGDLQIGPIANDDALKYDFSATKWLFDDPIALLDGQLETDPSTPTDLTIICGTQKTAVLNEPVWKDINLGAALLDPIPAFAPSSDTFDDETGTDTGIYTLSFGIGDRVSGSFEIQHDYKEGSDISFHLHWQGKAAPTGTDNVKWQLTYTISRDGQTLDAATVIVTPDTPISTQYIVTRSTFPNISGSTGGNNGGPIQIADQFVFTLERIAATGDAYAGGALIATLGLHYQVDTLGSRTIGAK